MHDPGSTDLTGAEHYARSAEPDDEPGPDEALTAEDVEWARRICDQARATVGEDADDATYWAEVTRIRRECR